MIEREPPCPKCGGEMERQRVDVGVGEIPFPFADCLDCGHREEPEPDADLIAMQEAMPEDEDWFL